MLDGVVSRKFEYASLNGTLTDSMKEQLAKFAAKKRLQSIPAPLVAKEFTPLLNYLSSLSLKLRSSWR
jgi:hypothetical protein